MKTYEDALEEVNTYKDKLDQVVDDGIKDVVVGLVMHGFVTSGSCEGHPRDSSYYNRCYPWVNLNYPVPENEWDEKQRDPWYLLNITQQQKLSDKLEAFYADHEPVIFKAMLVINSIGAGIAELRPYGAEFIELEEDFRTMHKIYLEEMNTFAKFLITTAN